MTPGAVVVFLFTVIWVHSGLIFRRDRGRRRAGAVAQTGKIVKFHRSTHLLLAQLHHPIHARAIRNDEPQMHYAVLCTLIYRREWRLGVEQDLGLGLRPGGVHRVHDFGIVLSHDRDAVGEREARPLTPCKLGRGPDHSRWASVGWRLRQVYACVRLGAVRADMGECFFKLAERGR